MRILSEQLSRLFSGSPAAINDIPGEQERVDPTRRDCVLEHAAALYAAFKAIQLHHETKATRVSRNQHMRQFPDELRQWSEAERLAVFGMTRVDHITDTLILGLEDMVRHGDPNGLICSYSDERIPEEMSIVIREAIDLRGRRMIAKHADEKEHRIPGTAPDLHAVGPRSPETSQDGPPTPNM